MEFDVTAFLIVCPLVFMAGLVDAVAGGGGLISLPAYLIAGLPPHYAIATNKLSSCMGTAAATWKFARNSFIPWKLALFCVPCGLLASALGARLALWLDEGIFTYVLLIILPLTALYVLRCKKLAVDREPLGKRRTWGIAMVVSLGIGVYDGFYGPGTGTFLILLLTTMAHLSLAQANGLTKAINLTTNVAALVVMIYYGKVVLLLGGVAACFSIAGNYVGAVLFAKGGGKIAKPMILIVLTIFMVKIITEKFFGL